MNTMTVQEAQNQQKWDSFLARQTFRPFLQSWTMGECIAISAEPIRLGPMNRGDARPSCPARAENYY